MIGHTISNELRDSLSREIVEENRRYESLKRQIQNCLQRNRIPISRNPLTLLIEEFRDELALRFTLEMATESFKEAIDAAPRLSLKAEELQSEQESLYQEICELADQFYRIRARGLELVPPEFVDRWKLFCKRLGKHDAAERDLIYEALFVDIGVGD